MGIFSIVRLRSIRNAGYAVEDLELILQTDIFISIDLSDGCWQASLPAGWLWLFVGVFSLSVWYSFNELCRF